MEETTPDINRWVYGEIHLRNVRIKTYTSKDVDYIRTKLARPYYYSEISLRLSEDSEITFRFQTLVKTQFDGETWYFNIDGYEGMTKKNHKELALSELRKFNDHIRNRLSFFREVRTSTQWYEGIWE